MNLVPERKQSGIVSSLRKRELLSIAKLMEAVELLVRFRKGKKLGGSELL